MSYERNINTKQESNQYVSPCKILNRKRKGPSFHTTYSSYTSAIKQNINMKKRIGVLTFSQRSDEKIFIHKHHISDLQ